jgi:TonB family protein
MWVRLFICLAASILIHFLFFSQSLDPPAGPGRADLAGNLVAVGLVQGVYQDRLKQVVKPAPPEEQKPDQEEGMSFVTEGTVSTGYMEVLKKKIFDTWQYPEEAVNNGEEGKVAISFVLDSTGMVREIGVLKSSGSPILDSAAMAAVEKASPFARFNGRMKDETLKITGNFCYVLD